MEPTYGHRRTRSWGIHPTQEWVPPTAVSIRRVADSGVRLSELLMALSLATDLGFGQPAEHMLRSARISMRLGDRLGLERAELADLYDVSILTYVGCPVHGNEG